MCTLQFSHTPLLIVHAQQGQPGPSHTHSAHLPPVSPDLTPHCSSWLKISNLLAAALLSIHSFSSYEPSLPNWL